MTGDLLIGPQFSLPENQSHQLKNVLRLRPGDSLRVFNGRDGEYLGSLQSFDRKEAQIKLTEQIHAQPLPPQPVHLFFAPIKRHRMDMLIEKSVELGVTDLHPVLTARTENRRLNEEKIQAQIIEAAEQCERLDLPRLHGISSLAKIVTDWEKDFPLLWANERGNNPLLKTLPGPHRAFLIGPEGGFSEDEVAYLSKQPFIRAVSLGNRILRAETAAFYCLSHSSEK